MSALLLLLPGLPLAASLALPLLPAARSRAAVPGGVIAAVLQVLATLLAWRLAPTDLNLPWLPSLGLQLQLGLDGLSLPLCLLTALISALAILATPNDQPRVRLFVPLLLACDGGVTTAFLARNALLFVLAFELVLIPTTLLVAIWGGPQRAGAAVRYLIYGALSGLTLLAAMLALGWAGGNAAFDFDSLSSLQLSPGSQRWILALLLIAFGLKLPIVPLPAGSPSPTARPPPRW
jgi:NAD(P)H-quinone oxidoreductase subunit 4